MAGFHKDFITSALMAELRARLLAEVVDALSAASIPVILLKGVAYATIIYADPAERPMSDIDLLVPPAAHADAARVLRRLGYWHAGSVAQASRFHHAVAFKRKDASIDLHRSIMQPQRCAIDIPGLWRRSRPAHPDSETSAAPRYLEAVDEAVICLAHIARHELAVPGINYIDAARLTSRAPGGHQAVLERARRYRLGRAISAALAMTACLVDSAPWRHAVLPGPDEILGLGRASRPRQLLRKSWLLEGPRELVGLAVAFSHGRIAHRLRRPD